VLPTADDDIQPALLAKLTEVLLREERALFDAATP
jgi:hypothetical protein